ITLAIIGILTVGLGIDFAIHLIVSYESYLERKHSHRQSIVLAVKHLYLAIIASFLTTVAGFGALLYGVSPATQTQGLVLVLSISVIAFLTILFFFFFLYLFGDGKLPPKNPFFTKIKSYLAKFPIIQTKRPKTILFILSVITVFMIFGAASVGFDTSNDNWIPPENPIQDSFRENSFVFGDDFSSVQIVLKTASDLRDVQIVRDIQNLERNVLFIPEIERVSSPFSNLQLDQQYIFENIDETAFPSDFTFATISVQATSFNTDSGGSSGVLDEIRDRVEQSPVYDTDVTLFGDVLRFQELGVSLGRDTGVTTLISFVLVFFIATILYMSFSVGFVAILPIIVGIIWTVGFKGYFGVPFTSLSTGLIALVLGIGIDFSIHLVNSTKNYIKEGDTIEEALVKTMSYSGGALLLTSITTFIGFASLTLASLLGIQRLGLSLAFSILSVFLVTIIMVPSILQLTLSRKQSEKKGKKK
ncbi:MAG: MMPL family transporter, partial [Candidatus Woesearchaeota archaeon]